MTKPQANPAPPKAGKESPAIAHFAYGSNMSTRRIERRVGPVQKRGVARLSEHEIRFDKESDDGSGKTNIPYAPGGEVWGVVFDLSPTQLETLAKKEKGYHEEVVTVQLNGMDCPARAFVADERVDGLLPTRRYLDYLIVGAREHKLPTEYIKMLESKVVAAPQSAQRKP